MISDRRTTLLLERLRTIAARKQRFSYDVRGDSYVYSDFVAPYRIENSKGEVNDLLPVLEHALAHDAIVSGVKDTSTGKTTYTSCRLFTDVLNATRFARTERQSAVYNWNRLEEVSVVDQVQPLPAATALDTAQ